MSENNYYDAGIGRFYEPMFGQKVRYSAFPDREGRFLYKDKPTFTEKLAEQYNYPTERDSKYGYEKISPDARPSGYDYFPNIEELADARAHIFGSALAARDEGVLPASLLGFGKEIADVAAGGVTTLFRPRGGISDIIQDSKMDIRNNAVGRQLLKKAGRNPTNRELAILADNAIFEQLERLRGRGQLDTSVKEGQPQLYFPRDEQGRFALAPYRP